MMRGGAALLVLAAAVTGRQPLGVFSSWGAFKDVSPSRCFAIAEPVQRGRGQPFASVADWPGRGARNQVQFRLSLPRSPQARVTLSIGDRRFDLTASDTDAWAPDTRTDQAIVAAMRSGRSMSVETLSRGGQPFADTYALKGAATAIDTATLACRW